MRRARQKGFTLLELMIATAIAGIILTVVSALFRGGLRGWTYSTAHISAQMQARAVRNNIIRMVRNSRASEIQIGRLDPRQPQFSMLLYVDAKGDSRAVYQKRDQIWYGTWAATTLPTEVECLTPTAVSAAQCAIESDVQSLAFFYPDYKNMRDLNFSFMLTRYPLRNDKKAFNPVFIQMIGDIQLRNP